MQTVSEVGNPLQSRGLKPVGQLAAGRDHGDRLRYMAGCRCFHCRRANTAYEAARKLARAAGDWNGLVSAEKARAHLASLSEQGVGRGAVQAASDVSKTLLSSIISGGKKKIRARTEKAILAVTVDARGDHSLVSAKQTWKRINELLKDGYTKAELAKRMGYSGAALQLNKKFVTARSAYNVELLYEELRYVNAKRVTAMLKSLKEEGFTTSVIERRLTQLALARGEKDIPSIEAKNGRVRHKTERLLHELSKILTE